MGSLEDAFAVLESANYWKAPNRLGKGFAVANPSEAQRVSAYVAALDAGQAPSPPTMNTLFGQGLVGMLAALAPAAPPPPPVVSITQSITEGATLTGSIAWTALPDPPPIKVDFLADGQVKWTEMTAPYVYNGDPGGLLDTNTLTNGTHTLVARAIYADGSTVSVSATVTIANVSPPRTVKISGRPVQGQTLTAVVA